MNLVRKRLRLSPSRLPPRPQSPTLHDALQHPAGGEEEEGYLVVEEDTDSSLIITMEESQVEVKAARRKSVRKRKKRMTGEEEERGGASESEEEEPVDIDRQLDQSLETKSRQHNLTTVNVRNIIHEVITNEHVVAMMKAAINDTEAVPAFVSLSSNQKLSFTCAHLLSFMCLYLLQEPKMTRAKFKEVVEKGVVRGHEVRLELHDDAFRLSKGVVLMMMRSGSLKVCSLHDDAFRHSKGVVLMMMRSGSLKVCSLHDDAFRHSKGVVLMMMRSGSLKARSPHDDAFRLSKGVVLMMMRSGSLKARSPHDDAFRLSKGVVFMMMRSGSLKAPQFVDIQLAEEDSSDEERLRAGPPMGPPPPPRAPPPKVTDSLFLEKLHAVEEELAVCLEPFQPLVVPESSGLMACRTRSKRTLRDVPLGRLEAELRAPDITPDMYDCSSAPEDRESAMTKTTRLKEDLAGQEVEDEGHEEEEEPVHTHTPEEQLHTGGPTNHRAAYGEAAAGSDPEKKQLGLHTHCDTHTHCAEPHTLKLSAQQRSRLQQQLTQLSERRCLSVIRSLINTVFRASNLQGALQLLQEVKTPATLLLQEKQPDARGYIPSEEDSGPGEEEDPAVLPAGSPRNIVKAFRYQHVLWPMLQPCLGGLPTEQRPPVEREEERMPLWLMRSLPVLHPPIRDYNLHPGSAPEAPPPCLSGGRHMTYSFPPAPSTPPTSPNSSSSDASASPAPSSPPALCRLTLRHNEAPSPSSPPALRRLTLRHNEAPPPSSPPAHRRLTLRHNEAPPPSSPPALRRLTLPPPPSSSTLSIGTRERIRRHYRTLCSLRDEAPPLPAGPIPSQEEGDDVIRREEEEDEEEEESDFHLTLSESDTEQEVTSAKPRLQLQDEEDPLHSEDEVLIMLTHVRFRTHNADSCQGSGLIMLSHVRV
ncbi:hypothetical protein F7725_024630 [Dissostichus mawsoni]|uniref:Uncharacterized protein n=1 Tax=Dissostichus mawsoni TaxID=36200 RepID=A0A7J5X8V0_DISMA|nr:hypothetical protein F7725_024630 [Dissostichus mawsoni]